MDGVARGREKSTSGNNQLESQERLVSFLESATSYPHRPPEVRLMQTHISWVFIAPPFVFKVKKPVNFGFFLQHGRRNRRVQREDERTAARLVLERIARQRFGGRDGNQSCYLVSAPILRVRNSDAGDRTMGDARETQDQHRRKF